MKSWVSFIIVFMVLFLIVGPIYGEDKRIIKPTKRIEDLRLMPSLWDEISKLPATEIDLILSTYVSGFWDALLLMECKAPTIQGLSSKYEGMSIEQVVEVMEKFYRENPQWRGRDFMPAFVLTVVIPRIRRGLPPLPVEKK